MIIDTLRKIKQRTRIRTRYRKVMSMASTAVRVYRAQGGRALATESAKALKKRLRKRSLSRLAGDVLFVSIDEPLLDRYRTDHMIESLESAGMSVGKVFYYELKPEHVKMYNVFIFYRCPWMPGYETILKEIKKRNKVTVYAVDDLVIDSKYTDSVPARLAMNSEERALYDEGVRRHNKLMTQCDYAITTTQCIADELKKYENFKKVIIDRNSMSDEMVYWSDEARRVVERDDNKTIIGYFSGTATHNEDFQMIVPALTRILDAYDNVYIKLAGRIDAPEALKDYEDRLIYMPYVDWRELPAELRECHINLSPLVDTLFNRGKSEIKWAESALVGVPVVASNIGAFKDSVENGVTGILVENTADAWYAGIRSLIEDPEKREAIGEQSRQHVLSHYRTTGNRATQLRDNIRNITPKIIAFGGVSLSAISGGNMVVKKHMDLLREAGHIVYGVESMSYYKNDKWQELNDRDDEHYDIFRINSKRSADRVDLRMGLDRFVATFWASVDMVDEYPYMNEGGKKLYLVQNMEADFYANNDIVRRKVLATYRNHRIQPITISKWCKGWLKSDFNREANYAPNGIDIALFPYHKRDFKNRKVKVLIEGDSASDYKRVDESFEIANKLDRRKFEVSYLSYNAEPKDWYKVDNTYIKVPYDKVGKIYAAHDILVKSSVLESFSYPPLEMMATGGVSVLVKNDGNAEYVIDGKNTVSYEAGDVNEALQKINDLVSDYENYDLIARNGRKTAESRMWRAIKSEIAALYE